MRGRHRKSVVLGWAAIVLSLLASVTPATAQAASQGCGAMGAYNGLLGSGETQSSGSLVNPGPFTPGDIVRFAWTGLSSIAIEHNGTTTHHANTSGYLDVTITGADDRLRWSAQAGPAGGRIAGSCSPAGSFSNPLLLPGGGGASAQQFLDQNLATAQASLLSDETSMSGFVMDPAADVAGLLSADGVRWSASLTPMAYAATDDNGLLDGLGGFAIEGWSLWSRGSISGLSGNLGGFGGRIDFGATRAFGNGFTAGGFAGWDGGTTNAAASGSTDSNALHFGTFGSYRLPNDIVVTVSGGAAIGSLTTTIAGDAGATGTMRAFLSAGVSGTVWEDGPWTIDASGSVFAGFAHQNAFTTNAGVMVPEQTVNRTSVSANSRVGYALPTEVPTQIFATAGVTLGTGTLGSGLSGNMGAGVSVTHEALRMSVSATYGGIGSAVRTWALNATIGISF